MEKNKSKKGEKVMKVVLIVFLTIVILFGVAYAACCGKTGSYYNDDGTYKHISKNNSYSYAINHPALDEFGKWILPWNDNFLAKITSPLRINFLMPMLIQVDVDNVIDGYNFVIDQANENKENMFYSYYSDADIEKDASKADTGLVFLRGNENAPFALVCPGGAFISVEANHEGYPVAKRLHDKGYNVFILRYRVQESYENADNINVPENCACDAGTALKWIFDNADDLNVSTDNYSLWGFSAGGYIVGSLGNQDEKNGYASLGLSEPAAVIMGYPALPDGYETSKSNTFIAMCEDDELIPFNDVKSKAETVKANGAIVEMDVYPQGGHGFGSGVGTKQDGWMDKATDFWEAQYN